MPAAAAHRGHASGEDPCRLRRHHERRIGLGGCGGKALNLAAGRMDVRTSSTSAVTASPGSRRASWMTARNMPRPSRASDSCSPSATARASGPASPPEEHHSQTRIRSAIVVAIRLPLRTASRTAVAAGPAPRGMRPALSVSGGRG
jgi:hypothetical protein